MFSLAWAAGLIDGEGCIRIDTGFRLVLKVKMTHLPTLERLMEVFSCGSVRPCKVKQGTRPQWIWSCMGLRAMKVIEEVSPYMVTKKQEALLALQYGDYCLSHKWERGTQSMREEFRSNLSLLKQ
jgi:hypothetical protein